MLNDNYNKLSNSIFHLLCLKNLKPENYQRTLFGGLDDTALDDVEE